MDLTACPETGSVFGWRLPLNYLRRGDADAGATATGFSSGQQLIENRLAQHSHLGPDLQFVRQLRIVVEAGVAGIGQHRGVFERRTRKRLPIRELFGPSLPHVFAKFIPEALKRGEESLVKNLQSELRFALSQGA